MKGQETIRVGVVGSGGIAQNQHIPGYLRCENVEITALCDINEEVLHTTGHKFSIPHLTTDYRELVELETLHAVDVCTAPDSHYPIAMAAIEQGKHIFCEKPLAMSYQDARRLHDAAKDAGLTTGVGFVHRVTPAARLAHQLLSEGALGDIYHVMAIFSAGGANYAAQPMRWRNSKAIAGAGALWDLGSHMIDMTCWWLNRRITGVCAQTRIFVEQRRWPGSDTPVQVDADDASTFLVNFEGGALGTFINSFVFTGRGFDQRVEVYGSNGALLYNQATPHALRVCVGEEMLKLSAGWGIGRRKEEPYPLVPIPENLKDRWSADGSFPRTLTPDFIAAIRGEEAFLPTFYDGMKVQEVLDAALYSAEKATWVNLPL
ncbi:Gfo/Idh/MocA family oxidoreductase [Chloroflexi bacterium TSY]|nr:Gfo/Idh/MocA family oxidoreductase [Chloroflexi bacterium TSY]